MPETFLGLDTEHRPSVQAREKHSTKTTAWVLHLQTLVLTCWNSWCTLMGIHERIRYCGWRDTPTPWHFCICCAVPDRSWRSHNATPQSDSNRGGRCPRICLQGRSCGKPRIFQGCLAPCSPQDIRCDSTDHQRCSLGTCMQADKLWREKMKGNWVPQHNPMTYDRERLTSSNISSSLAWQLFFQRHPWSADVCLIYTFQCKFHCEECYQLPSQFINAHLQKERNKFSSSLSPGLQGSQESFAYSNIISEVQKWWDSTARASQPAIASFSQKILLS